MKTSKYNSRAFTLLELLVTLFIIAVIISLSVIVYDVTWSKSRDSKRVSDIIRIQNALEKYHQQQGQYPDSLTFGSDLVDSSTNVYLIKTPQNPTPRDDGDCADQEYKYSTSTDFYGNESFLLEFCLGNKSDQIEKGINCATSQGIIHGSCNSNNLRSGLKLWLKADGNVASHTVSGNALIDSWNDESGNNNNVSQADLTKKPILIASTTNSRPAVRFDGSDDFLSGGDILDMNNGDWTMYVIGKDSAANGTFLSKSIFTSAAGRYALLYYNGNLLYTYEDNDGPYNVQKARTPGNYEILATERNKQLLKNTLSANNVAVGSTTIGHWHSFDTNFRFLVGAYNNSAGTGETQLLNGDINEILIYNRILSTSEKNQLYTYLQDKYGL